jgi:hypothetical protein
MYKRILFLSIIICLIGYSAHSQDCRVLIEEISKSYQGDCKKGLAHGEGIAIGEVYTYEGDFKKGLPAGDGKLTFDDGKVFEGKWKAGEIYGFGVLTEKDGSTKEGYFKGSLTSFMYMGEDKSSLAGYKIIEKQRMENATFQFANVKDLEHELQIQVFENNIRKITNVEILEMTSGSINRQTNSNGRLNIEIVRVKFPITLGLRYILPYGTQDTNLPGDVENLNSPRMFRFTLIEPGSWTVTITHR